MLKTLFITGGSQGIGFAIAHRFAKAGCQIVIASKDTPSNMQYASEQIVKAGGKALTIPLDVSNEIELKEAVEKAKEKFGGIDFLIHNTSATFLLNTMHTLPSQFDLMMSTSVRAAFFLTQACLPSLKASSNPHIIHISPPLNMQPHWFKDYLAFSICKYAMSMCTLGMAEEFKEYKISVNSLWPETTIGTPTVEKHLSKEVYLGSRKPEIMGDAAYELVKRKCTGRFFTDEEILREAGMTDFSSYAIDVKKPLWQSLYVSKGNPYSPIPRDLFRP